MPFRWSVDPYMFRYEMQDAYTRLLLTTTKGVAEKQAKEAEQWMKENAPWTDLQPNASPSRRARSFHARRNLKAYVPIQAEEKKLEDALKRSAAELNASRLQELNAGRRSRGQIELKRLTSSMGKYTYDMPKRPILVRLILAHGESVSKRYGLWLEVGFQGRYAIIAPAVSYWGAKTMRSVQAIINLKKFKIDLKAMTYVTPPGSRIRPYVPRNR